MIKIYKSLQVLALAFLVVSAAFSQNSPCNNLVHISVDANCDANDITPDMFLEGDVPDYSLYSYVVYDLAGYPLISTANPNTILRDYLNLTLTVRVFNQNNLLVCWGFVIFEDKLVPTLTCECPVGGSIPAGVPFDNPFSGELTTSDVVASIGGAPCWPAPPAAGDHYVDLYEFTVDVTGVYTLTMFGFGDGIAAIYEDEFDPKNPCQEDPIVQDDDSFGVGSEPQLITALTAGQTYVLVSSGWAVTDLGTYSWNYSGPGNLVTTKGQYDEDCTLNCFEYDLVKAGYETTIPFDFLEPGIDDILDGVTDNCDNYNPEDLQWTDHYFDSGTCNRKFVRRSYSVTYDAQDENNPFDTKDTLYCTQEFVFEVLTLRDTVVLRDASEITPIEDSIILPLRVVELPCGAGTSPEAIMAYFDNPATEDRDTDDDNIDPDEGDVDLVIEDNEGVPYAYPHYYTIGTRGLDPQPISIEVCNIIVGYTDIAIDACTFGCNGNSKILRTWALLDWCTGELLSYDQIVKAVDQTDPVIDVHDITLSVDPWECAVNVNLPHPEHIYDDCDGNLTYWIGFTSDAFNITGDAVNGYMAHDVPVGYHTFEYVTEDCCGNQGKYYMSVYVKDHTPPVAVAKEFIVLSLTNIGNPNGENGIGKIYAIDVDNGSYDGCSSVALAVKRTTDNCGDPSNLEYGEFVKFCCDDLLDAKIDSISGLPYSEVEVMLRVTDEQGNTNETWALVRVEDKAAPAVICPDPMILGCDMDIDNLEMTGVPEIINACGEAEIDWYQEDIRTEPRDKPASIPPYAGQSIPAYNPSCGYGAIRRQFRLNNSTACEQWFVIEPVDSFDPSSIAWPSNQVLDCLDADSGEPTWLESTCELVGISLETDTFLFEDGACYKVLNHWSVINWCLYDPAHPTAGGRYNWTQVIKVIDTEDPEVDSEDNVCFAVDVNCLSKGVTLTASATDNGACASDWIKWEVSVDYYADWTEDEYHSTFLPRIVNGEPNPYYVPATGNGGEVSVKLNDGLSPSTAMHRVIWKAHDGCNNVVSLTRYFQIADKKPPTPYCLNLSTAVMENGSVELWAIDFNQGSFDNCTDGAYLLYTFTNQVPPQLADPSLDPWYDEDGEARENDYLAGDAQIWRGDLNSSGLIFDLNAIDSSDNGMIELPVYVWDESGNSDFCVVNLRLIDNGGGGSAMIAGQIAIETGAHVAGVDMELVSDLPEYPRTQTTDGQGAYAFSDNEMFSDYGINAQMSGNYLEGVSTLDLVLMQRHVLGQQKLDSPYKMIAADVNCDNNVSALDLLELRKLILGIYDEMPQCPSWKFIDASQDLTTDNPWVYSEDISIDYLSTDLMAEDFVAIKMGDVNSSIVLSLNGGQTSDSRVAGIEMVYEDKDVEKGEVIDIPVSGKLADVYGYQFTLATSGLALQNITAGAVTVDESNFGVFQNHLTTSWHSNQPITADGDLFVLTFKAQENGRLSDMLGVNSEITRAEAYVGEALEIVNIDLDTPDSDGFVLYQNQPNPFNGQTRIGFTLPQDGEATLSVYDVTGKVVRQITGSYNKGYNAIEMNDLKGSGLMYYTLTSGQFSATKHMIITE